MINATSAVTGAFGRAAIAGLALAGSLAFAAPAAAAVQVIDVRLFDWSIGATAQPVEPTVHLSPFEATLKVEGLTFDALAFCIQLGIDMPGVEGGGVSALNLMYQEGPLTSEDNARVGKLVNFGTKLWNEGGVGLDHDLGIHLAAIQGAIWELTSDADVQFAGFFDHDIVYNDLLDDYRTTFDLTSYSSYIHTIYAPTNRAGAPLAQGLAYSGALPVPEPTTWALMLTGFFGAGFALRRRRALAIA